MTRKLIAEFIRKSVNLWDLCGNFGVQYFRYFHGDVFRKRDKVIKRSLDVLFIRIQLERAVTILQKEHRFDNGIFQKSTRVSHWENISFEF